MKLITAIIRPFKLDEVRQALLRFGRVASIAEVKALTPRREDIAAIHGAAPNAFFAKIKIEVLVPTEEADKAIDLLRQAALTNRLGEGDGLIFVSNVERALRIRTGAADDKAL